MNSYIISGIQQIGIGVSDLDQAWKWYNRHFGMDCRIFEDVAEAKLMLPYTGGKPRSRHAVLALNLQSGISKIGNRALNLQSSISNIGNMALKFQSRISKIRTKTLKFRIIIS